MNEKINIIADALEHGYNPILRFTFLLTNTYKEGGTYVNMTERVRRIDTTRHKVEFFKKTGLSDDYMTIDMDKIFDISGDLVDHPYLSSQYEVSERA